MVTGSRRKFEAQSEQMILGGGPSCLAFQLIGSQGISWNGLYESSSVASCQRIPRLILDGEFLITRQPGKRRFLFSATGPEAGTQN